MILVYVLAASLAVAAIAEDPMAAPALATGPMRTNQDDAEVPAAVQPVEVPDKSSPMLSSVAAAAAGHSKEVFPRKRYDGHAVLKALPVSDEQQVELTTLLKSGAVDVWRNLLGANQGATFRVPPSDFNWTISYLDEKNIKYEILNKDIQKIIDADDNQMVRLNRANSFGWDNFYRLGSMYGWMESLVQRFPNVSTLMDGGRSYEGRHMLGVRIAHAENLPVFYLEGGIHGREWISPAAATYILDQLLNSQDPQVARVARSFEWHIFPSVNPDAYEYTHTTDRLWRKSRKPTTFQCTGADLNRNFPSHWGETGVSWSFCDQTFPGTRSESELETRTRIRYMEDLLPRMKAFVALHSFGQYLLLPWGRSISRPETYPQLLKVASRAAAAFTARHGSPLTVGSLATTLYPASGNAMDWAYERKVPFSFSIELRDTGRYGFLLPKEQIVAGSEEALNGIVALAEGVLEETSSS